MTKRRMRMLASWRLAVSAVVVGLLALVATTGAASQPDPLHITAVAVQRDGHILVAGHRDVGGGNLAFAVARYDANGVLDDGFGVGGVATTDFGPGEDVATGLVVQRDGKIVLAGHSYGTTGEGTFALARYEPDGSLDGSFGDGGKVTTSFGFGLDSAAAVTLQDDGKIVAAGVHNDYGTPGYYYAALARYDAAGGLDPSFGTDGKLVAAELYTSASAVAIGPGGAIVAAGVAGHLNAGQFLVLRLEPDGSPDESFGSGGAVHTSFDPGDFQAAEAVAVRNNGRIVAAGLREGDDLNTDFALARYRPDGALDPRFGGGGEVTSDFGGRESIQAIALDHGGDILAAGTYIVRYDRHGRLDASFGSGGKIDRAASSLAIQRDGKIVAGGGTELARYTRDGSPDSSFGSGGVVETS